MDIENQYNTKLSYKALSYYVGNAALCFFNLQYRFRRIYEYDYENRRNIHVIMSRGTFNSKSYAAYIMLKNYYYSMDTNKSDLNNWQKWIIFRRKYLRKVRLEKGDLVCEYCGKKHLKVISNNHKNVATIDHVKPLSDGVDRYDTRNFAISCTKCNQEKGSQDYTMLLMKRRNYIKYLLLTLITKVCTFLKSLSRS